MLFGIGLQQRRILVEPEELEHLGPFVPRLEDYRDLPVLQGGLSQNHVIGNLLGVLELLGVCLADGLEKGP